VKAITNKPPFEVLSLAGSIADALQIWLESYSRGASYCGNSYMLKGTERQSDINKF
jgi:hypothetical protein